MRQLKIQSSPEYINRRIQPSWTILLLCHLIWKCHILEFAPWDHMTLGNNLFASAATLLYVLGVIHKPRGQNFEYI